MEIKLSIFLQLPDPNSLKENLSPNLLMFFWNMFVSEF